MRDCRIVLMFLFAVVAAVPTSAGDGPAQEPNSFRVVGYLPDYRAAEFDLVTARGLTDLILFSAEPTETGALELSRLKNVPWAKLRAFKTVERVRLILAVGGWDRSTHFSTVAGSDLKRQTFVNTAVRVCLDERLEGVDLDWEHPSNEAEVEGYAKLLDELHLAFEPHGLVLSVTLAGWQSLPRKAFDAVDWVNVMSYDNPGRHSTFEAAQADVKRLIDAGATARKINLGLPFYGRDKLKPEQTMTYREIIAKHRLGPDVDEIGSLYFNGPATIGRKTEYALQSHLAGVMVWELGQDAAGDQSLLKVIHAVLERSPRK